jgi:hypothetical protein
VLGVWSKAITAPASAGAFFLRAYRNSRIWCDPRASLVVPASRPFDIVGGIWDNLRSCFRLWALAFVSTESSGLRRRKKR